MARRARPTGGVPGPSAGSAPDARRSLSSPARRVSRPPSTSALAALGISLDGPLGRRSTDTSGCCSPGTPAINLTAIRDPAAVAVRHVADSLSALAELRRRGIDRFVDLGSGGGFPGLTLAAALPADRALLVDSVAKKAAFWRP